MEKTSFDVTAQQYAKAHCPMAAWVSGLARWEVISHLTFRWEASAPSVQRCFEKFMRTKLPGVSYFYAIERNPNRLGNHVHCLWADAEGVQRKRVWADWLQRYGRGRIEPVRNHDDVTSYCSKYVTKEVDTWWNVKLVGGGLWSKASGVQPAGKLPAR